MKPTYLYTFGKKVINSCNTEAQLKTARNWVNQLSNFNPDLAVALSFELSERTGVLNEMV